MTARAVLITGAARRLGRELVLRFARQGWDIGLHYRSSAVEAEELAAAVEGLGPRCALIQADLAKPGSAQTVTARFFAEFPEGSVLINNASIYEHDTIDSLERALWQRHMDVNALAPILLGRAFAERLDSAGAIINLLDQKVSQITPDYFSYTLSKLVLFHATRMLAMSLAPRCRVNAIAPGLTLRSGDQSDADFARVHGVTPLGVGPTVEEICAAAMLIVTSPAMTGQVITIDGGRHLMPADPAGDLPRE